MDKIDSVSAIDATTNAIDRSSHATWFPEMCNYSISLGSLCHDFILQAFYHQVKGSFAPIMGTYTHFRDFGDQYVRKLWHLGFWAIGVEANVRVWWYILGLVWWVGRSSFTIASSGDLTALGAEGKEEEKREINNSDANGFDIQHFRMLWGTVAAISKPVFKMFRIN